MRLRRLCLEIFALRLFLREPIQVFGFASRIQPLNTLRCNFVLCAGIQLRSSSIARRGGADVCSAWLDASRGFTAGCPPYQYSVTDDNDTNTGVETQCLNREKRISQALGYQQTTR